MQLKLKSLPKDAKFVLCISTPRGSGGQQSVSHPGIICLSLTLNAKVEAGN